MDDVQPDLHPHTAAEIDRFADMLVGATRLLFVTGAGISADSGLPTYRGIGGLYEADTTEDGIPIEDALSGEMLAVRPDICWKHIHTIEAACRGARPNGAHEVIVALASRVPHTWVLTQNVDGLHVAAGSREVIEIHGNIHDLDCTRCDWHARVPDYAALAPVPRCPRCDAVVRPRVVLFGEALPVEPFETLRRQLGQGFDAVIAIGTTAVFPYIAGPVIAARRHGIPTIEVNPGRSEISGLVDLHIRDRAEPTLLAMWRALQTR